MSEGKKPGKIAEVCGSIGIGAALGAAFGAAFEQLALGVALGTAIGGAMAVMEARRRDDNEPGSGPD